MTGTRDRLLTATNESFRRRGYHGTSVKDVTVAARAPTGSLYHFFPGGKDELTAAVITSSGAAYRELFEAIAGEAASPAAAITDFFDGAATVLEETDFIDPCPIGTVAREVASTNEPLRVATAQVFASWIDAATARLARGRPCVRRRTPSRDRDRRRARRRVRPRPRPARRRTFSATPAASCVASSRARSRHAPVD